jgi:SAM-dependent methyltransferase
MKNPWLKIPAADYEAHMASPEVAQCHVISSLFSEVLRELLTSSVAVLGCTTGNGFENVDPTITERVVGVDINQSYLEILRERFLKKIPCLELVEADISSADFQIEPVSVIFAVLVFEFVDVLSTLKNISKCLKPGGTLVAAIQVQNSDTSPVTPTAYTSLRRLDPIINLISPIAFTDMCINAGLKCVRNRKIQLKNEKSLFVGFYQKVAEPINSADPKERAAD